jgi:hypothetical protein
MKYRRGLSSVIGMIFLVIVLSSVLGYFTYGIHLVEQVNDQVITKGIESIDKSKENFEITNVRIDAGKFNLTVQNTGEIPLNLTRFWINNVTDSSWPLQNFTINTIVTPKQIMTNIGQDAELYALDSQAYSMKLITQRGNSKEISINSPNQEKLDLKLIALPETVPDKFRTTLLFTVTNNMTNQNTLLNIKPIMETPQNTGTATETLITSTSPNQISNLRKGDSATFIWIYEISGSVGDSITFTVSLENGYPENSASATVLVNDVLLSQQSTTALSASTISDPGNKDLLMFHSETEQTPSGEYQMYAGDQDTAGTTISVETDNPDFFTNNGTAVNISAGIWNASLRYFSAPFPDSLMDDNDDNMILHFESNSDPEDSTENTSGHTLGSSTHRPTFQSTGGPHSSGAFSFDGGDYIEINVEAENNIHRAADATSLWFKATDGISGKQILYHASQNNDDEYYEIGIDANDNVYFEFLTQKNKTPTKCISNGFDYENDKWQHLVAVRPTDQSCALYINATSVSTSSAGTGDGDINIDEIFIGAEDNNPGYGFNGIIDDVLHWDNYALISGEVTDLKNTNYGNAAHLVTFYMNKTDENGIFISNIGTDSSYPLKFLDGKKNGEFLTSFNYTKSIESSVSFLSTQRLVFDMQFESGLDMDMRIDDTSMTLTDNSFLQTPSADYSFSSYLTIIGDQSFDIQMYNVGPETAWITFAKTRITFDDVSSSNTYASLLLQANGTDVTSNQDSIAFPALTTLDLTFSSPKNPPSTSGSTGIIMPGRYAMIMHIEGYDINGASVSKTVNFGTVSVK